MDVKESDMYSDGLAHRVEDMAIQHLDYFEIPEMILTQTREELTRRIMEFVDVQRNILINELKQKKDNTVEGQQLHHVAYLEAE